jgi:hypothetical protein
MLCIGEGSHEAGGLSLKFSSMGLSEPEEARFSYWVYFTDSWDTDNDGEIGKLPGFMATYGQGGWGGHPSNGYNGWSARMSNYDRGSEIELGFYVYHADMTGTYGDHMRWDIKVNRNEWVYIEERICLNSIEDGISKYDGVLEGWVNGSKAFERSDLRFRHTKELKIEKFWLGAYVGGAWTADKDMTIYFDDAHLCW